MARSMKNKERKEAKLLETRAELVRAALESGHISRKDICSATGLKLHELANLFTLDRKVYGEYVVRRKTISDIASDNILDIVNDASHPQHFSASKYITGVHFLLNLQTFLYYFPLRFFSDETHRNTFRALRVIYE